MRPIRNTFISKHPEFLKAIVGSSGLKAFNVIISLAIGVLLARLLGTGEYGVYAFAMSVVTLLGIPLQGGLPALVVRETARFNSNDEKGKIKSLIMASNVLVAIISLLIVVLVIGCAILFVDDWDLRIDALAYAVFLVPLIALANVRAAVLKGLKKVVFGTLPEQAIRPFSFFLILCIYWWSVTPINSALAVKYSLLSALISFFCGFYFLKKHLNGIPVKAVKIDKEEYKSWGMSMVPLTLFASLSIANNQLGIVVLGGLGFVDEAGLYRVAFQGAMIIGTALLIVENSAAPYIVAYAQNKDYKAMQGMLARGTIFNLMVTTPILVLFVFFGEYFVVVLFGEEFIEASKVLLVLALGQFFRVLMGPAGLVLNMLNKEKIVFYCALFSVLVNGCLTVLLSFAYGAIGAAISASLTMCIWSASLAYFSKKKVGVHTVLRLSGASFEN